MWQHWVNAILGLGVIAVPFLSLASDTMTWTLAVGGAAIAVLAVWGALSTSEESQQMFQTR